MDKSVHNAINKVIREVFEWILICAHFQGWYELEEVSDGKVERIEREIRLAIALALHVATWRGWYDLEEVLDD